MANKRERGEYRAVRDPTVRRARAEVIVAQRMKGVPVQDTARHFGIHRRTVFNEVRWAEQQGIVTEMRERMKMELLPQAVDVYKHVFETDAASLADRTVLKGHELKLKAARHITEGLGALRKDAPARTQETLDLTGYYALRNERQRATVEGVEDPCGERDLLGDDGGAGADGEGGGHLEGLVLDARTGVGGEDGGGGAGESGDGDGDSDGGDAEV